MPIFEYMCAHCGAKFEKLVLSASRERQIRCPECGSDAVEKTISTFSTGGGASRSTATNCAPSG